MAEALSVLESDDDGRDAMKTRSENLSGDSAQKSEK